MQAWQLPEYIADILPANARQVESAKERLLELFRVHGFELVIPPMMEYTASLQTRTNPGIDLQTIRVVDQLSGLQLGFRADITPQIARIDAHLLASSEGVNRLCYSGTVLLAKPDNLLSSREPWQIGAEIYGFAGIEADLESIDLMLKSLRMTYVDNAQLALGHIGVFNALAQAAGLDRDGAMQLLLAMQSKEQREIRTILNRLEVLPELAAAFLCLPSLYGDVNILEEAKRALPDLSGIQDALRQLDIVCQRFQSENIHIDLSELRVDTYHTGLLYAAYAPKWADAVARGGRYDGLGQIFGRVRPATGFTLYLKDLMKILPKNNAKLGIKVSLQDYEKALPIIEALRSQGEAVVIDYINQSAHSLHCNRQLVLENGQWQVINCIT